MPGITVKDLDTAGGMQLAGQQDAWKVSGKPIVLEGDMVAGHGLPPHTAPSMVAKSSWMTINGVRVIRETDQATCGHPTTGRPWFVIP